MKYILIQLQYAFSLDNNADTRTAQEYGNHLYICIVLYHLQNALYSFSLYFTSFCEVERIVIICCR